MPNRPIHSAGTYAHFVTFSTFKRRKLLNPDACKRIVVGNLAAQLIRQKGICIGYVIMPDHVHALIWFPDEHQISPFMNKWKDLTSRAITDLYQKEYPNYSARIGIDDPVWQRNYYDFNISSDAKLREKLDYMHKNPVRKGLVKDICDWRWSSAQGWHQHKSVGVKLSWPP